MNIVLGVIGLIFSIFAGYALSAKYVERKKFYSDFSAFNKRLISEVAFAKNSIVALLESGAAGDGAFSSWTSAAVLRKEGIKITFLSDEESEYVKNYLEVIGSGDKKSQIAFLESVTKYVDDASAKSTSDEKKYRSLYVKLGFLIGLIVLIALL